MCFHERLPSCRPPRSTYTTFLTHPYKGQAHRFFGKFKDPKTSKWLKIPGGKFPAHVNTPDLARQFAERWYEFEIVSKNLDATVPVTWSDICERYATHIEQGGKGVATKHEATVRARSLAKSRVLNARPLAEHDERLVLAWLNATTTEEVPKKGGAKGPRKFRTIRNLAKIVRYVYRFAQSHKAFPKGELPTSGLLFVERMTELQRADPDASVACPRASVTKLLKAAERDEQRRLLDHLGAMTAARPGELHGLLFEDVKMQNEVVYLDINKQYRLARGKEPAGLGPLKSKAAERRIPLHAELLPGLKQWMAKGWRKHVGRDPATSDFLFVDSAGNPYREHDSDEFRAELAAAQAATEVDGEPLTRYSLRHTWATEALKAGLTSEARDYLMGHARADTKGRHYEEPDLKYMAEQINKIPGFLVESEQHVADDKPRAWSQVWSQTEASGSPAASTEGDDDSCK